MKKYRGQLIVIDGVDKSGKATQTKLLVRRLKREGRRVATLDFPQYKKNLFGKLIFEALAGKHGDFLALSPFIASTLYAADRYESKAKIEAWLNTGYTVVLDRYVSSNQIHQGGKIKDTKKRTKFLAWLDRMEHGVFKLPRPDAIIYLDMPLSVNLKLLESAYSKKGKRDMVENDLVYYRNSKQSSKYLAERRRGWITVSCVEGNKLLPPREVHEKIYAALKW